MSGQQPFVRLREILAYLYAEDVDARRVAQDADLDVGHIPFSNKSVNNWDAIVNQAQKEGKTANLMAITLREYKENEKLSKAWHDYLLALGQKDANVLLTPRTNPITSWPLGWIGIATIILIIGITMTPLKQYIPSGHNDIAAPTLTVSTPVPPNTTTPSGLLRDVAQPKTAIPIPTTLMPTSKLANDPISTTPSPMNQSHLSTTVIAPINFPKVGILDIRSSLEGCGSLAFDVVSNDKVTGGGEVGEVKKIAVGSYNIVIKTEFGDNLTKEGVIIEDNQTTVIDIGQQVGKLRVNGYPQIGGPPFTIDPQGRSSRGSPLIFDDDHCGIVGFYTIEFQSKVCSGVLFSAYCVTTAILPSDISLKFDIELKPGEITLINPNIWPKQFGLLAFDAKESVGSVQIEDLQNTTKYEYTLDNGGGEYWMLAGRYKITLMMQPYTGTIYEFEVKPGDKTTLHLQPSS